MSQHTWFMSFSSISVFLYVQAVKTYNTDSELIFQEQAEASPLFKPQSGLWSHLPLSPPPPSPPLPPPHLQRDVGLRPVLDILKLNVRVSVHKVDTDQLLTALTLKPWRTLTHRYA